MRRAIVIAILLASATAHAQVEYENPWTWQKFLPRNMRSSPLLSKYVFTSYGEQAWRAPAPTIDCRAAASGGDLVCSGATFAKSGTPSTVASPYYWGGAAQPAVSLNGSTDYWSATGPAGVINTLVVCTSFASRLVNGSEPVVAMDNNTGKRQWGMRATASGLIFDMWNAAVTNGQFNVGAMVASSNNSGCVLYKYVTDGTSIIRANLNGVAPAEKTNAPGPIPDLGAILRVGSDWASGTRYLTGTVANVRVWVNSWEPSASDLALAVRAMQASLGTRGEVVTTANAAAEYVPNAAGTAEYLIPANTPRVVGGVGLAVYGANSSRIARNQRDSTNTANGGICGTVTSNWTVGGTATCQATPVLAPDGTLTAERVCVSSGANAIVSSGGGFTANATVAVAAWLKRESTSGILHVRNANTGLSSFTLDMSAVDDSWHKYTGTTTATAGGAAGIQLLTATGSVCFHIWRPWQMDNSAVPGPDFEIQASVPGTRGATTVSVPNAVAPQPFCVTTKVTPSSAAATRLLFAGGTVGINSLQFYLDSANKLGVYTVDGASASKTWMSASAVTPAATHSFCYDPAAVAVTMATNGAMDTVAAPAGTGTGLSAYQSTIQIGDRSGALGGSSALNGYVERFCQCRGSNPLACERECLK